ncbi:uncharacterized protein LOC124997350 isoform X2 [Mugil cephalus]|nr:uncharacterized protein LOC124997350 isoform X2 [Mugil cephalus]
MDKDSVITRDCQDLTVKLIVPNGRFVKEICVNFKTAASTEPETSSDTSWAFIIGVVLAVVALVCGWCVMWKKKLKKRCGRATATGLLKEVQISCCARNGTCQPNRGERDKARNYNESHPGGAGDLGTQHDNDIRNEQSSDRNPRGCGAANTERSNILERVVVQRNLGHDPGGVNSCNKEDIARDVASAWPIGAGGLDAEEHETEGRQLLLNQRAANRASDQGGEAIALVDKHSFENEPVSGCSNALDTDVESNEELQY